MADIAGKVSIEFRVLMTINEEEARALDAMAVYGDDASVKAFYENLGEGYMKRYENGLRSFLKSVRNQIKPILGKMAVADVNIGTEG